MELPIFDNFFNISGTKSCQNLTHDIVVIVFVLSWFKFDNIAQLILEVELVI